MHIPFKNYLPVWFSNLFKKGSGAVYQDTIIDSLACWEIIWSDEEMLTSLKNKESGGIWAAREAVASKIMPAVRSYYAKFGEDVDFDGVFIEPLLIAMYRQNWCLNTDYSKVCIETRTQWF